MGWDARDTKDVAMNLYFLVTCLAIFTSTIRSDYNFAVGLLCYYLIKNCEPPSEKIQRTFKSVSDSHTHDFYRITVYFLTIMTCAVDGVWIATDKVMAEKQMTEGKAWHGFQNINEWVMALSVTNVFIKMVACGFLGCVYRGSKPTSA